MGLRPGLHLGNSSQISPADEDIIRKWAPLSALLAMDNLVEDNDQITKLVSLWDLAGKPVLILRKYIAPECASLPRYWSIHAVELCLMAKRCIARGIPLDKLMLKPFNEPNMPAWAQWEGFGDKEGDIVKYNTALKIFIYTARNELPGIKIGGPHLTCGNKDVRFPSDGDGRYYYGPESLCQEALDLLDAHFVHCYGNERLQYKSPYHGLRFLEYEKYFSKNVKGRPIYIVEGAYGIKWENGNAINPQHNNVRGEDTVDYLRILGEHPQVKGITLWIAGDRDWQEYRHSDGWDAGTHRPVVTYVESYVKGEQPPVPPEPTPPTPPVDPVPVPVPVPVQSDVPPLTLLTYDGRELVGETALRYVTEEYGSRIIRYPGSRFSPPVAGDLIMRIVRIEEREGPHEVKCRMLDGSIATFGFRWDEGPVVFQDQWYPRGDQRVGPDVGFIYGPQSITYPGVPGGHALWIVSAPSDLADGWGWKPMTVHRALNLVFDAIPYKEDALPNEPDYPAAQWVGPAAEGNFETGRGNQLPRYIILHGTAKGADVSCDAPLGRYAVNLFKQVGSKVSAHYVVFRGAGGIEQVVAEADTAFHAGRGTGYNPISIGIEGVHCGCTDHPWETAVVEGIIKLVRYLAPKYGIARDHVILHKEVPGADTLCPVIMPKKYILDQVFGEETAMEFTDDQIMKLVYGVAWTDRWAGISVALEHSQFFPILFASQFQGNGVIEGTRVDWQLSPDLLIYWVAQDWQTPHIMRWPPQVG